MKKIQIIIIVSLALLFQGCIGWLVGDPRPYKCNIEEKGTGTFFQMEKQL